MERAGRLLIAGDRTEEWNSSDRICEPAAGSRRAAARSDSSGLSRSAAADSDDDSLDRRRPDSDRSGYRRRRDPARSDRGDYYRRPIAVSPVDVADYSSGLLVI